MKDLSSSSYHHPLFSNAFPTRHFRHGLLLSISLEPAVAQFHFFLLLPSSSSSFDFSPLWKISYFHFFSRGFFFFLRGTLETMSHQRGPPTLRCSSSARKKLLTHHTARGRGHFSPTSIVGKMEMTIWARECRGYIYIYIRREYRQRRESIK